MEDTLIANILYKEMFSYNTVFLQNVGFLALVDHSASLSPDGSTLRPPYRTVAAYHVDEQIQNYVDVVMAICQSASVDYQAAYSIYDGYIRRHLTGNILTLPYVMQIRLDDMAILGIDERMRTALENQYLSPVALREPVSTEENTPRENPRRRLPYRLSAPPGSFQLALAIIVFSAAVIYLVYSYFLKDFI